MSRIYYWYLPGSKLYYYPTLSMIEALFYLIPEARLTHISETSKIITINLKTYLVFFFCKSNTPGFHEADGPLISK